MKSILIGILTSILLLVIYYFAIAFVSLDLDFRQWNSDCRELFVVMGFFIGAAGGFAAAIGHNIYMEKKKKKKIKATMKKFYKESGMLVCEFEEFKRSLLLGTYGFKLSAEQWKNRRTGRTKVKPEERIAMQHILIMIRQKTSYKTEAQTFKFPHHASTL